MTLTVPDTQQGLKTLALQLGCCGNDGERETNVSNLTGFCTY